MRRFASPCSRFSEFRSINGPTAALGGIFGLSLLFITMAYNHPYSKNARIYFAVTPIVPNIKGRVIARFDRTGADRHSLSDRDAAASPSGACIPAALVLVAAATIVIGLLGGEATGVNVAGHLPSGLPHFMLNCQSPAQPGASRIRCGRCGSSRAIARSKRAQALSSW